jgi:hypothetical protein
MNSTEKDNATTPARGGSSHAFSISDMPSLEYMEAIPRTSCLEWRKDASKKISPRTQLTEQNLANTETPMKERHNIGHLWSNLES